MIKNIDGETKILCPVCNYDYTSHSVVRSYERDDGEDGLSYERMVGSELSFVTRRNPSPRRGAISIVLQCESGHPFTMNVIQHKGQSLIEFKEIEIPF